MNCEYYSIETKIFNFQPKSTIYIFILLAILLCSTDTSKIFIFIEFSNTKGCPVLIRTLLNMSLTLFQNNHKNKFTVPSTDQNLPVRFCLEIDVQHNISLVMTIHSVTLTLTRSSRLLSRERSYL